jgi:NADPH:quinone reductase
VTVMGAAWREFLSADPGFVTEAGAALGDLVASGRLTPLLGTTYALEDGAQALRDLADRRAVGKLVLTVR